ncbi:hypothetical protein E1B28_007833 [Marasmius oreades]|uniref:C2H2-type domain-containing protein n=1 Tax=Marasmius oreades TaxID=181124 RepID=A0A9P7S2P6_9AGAR|nr:uncharacterized protein E1B28_007833 [Marasmius oreades]KAG7094227.1 hypothetical protein E1B28_007833 [Marasmius oreades]
MAFKRPRHPSDTSSDSSLSPPSSPSSPSHKSSRILPDKGAHQLLCTLPPTCNHRPTYLANSKDLEAHYATYHAHVCEEKGCNCVFPDARLLELHQTECHDSLAAVRKDRGEKIFACFLASCPRLFGNPKTRRLHLIQAHAYPKEYFFAVTNKGVGGLLKKWGEGASMLRGEWKKREYTEENKETIADDRNEEAGVGDHLVDDTSDGEESDVTERQSAKGFATKIGDTRKSLTNNSSIEARGGRDQDIEELNESMTSLSLIPSSIQFGRGSAKAGFSHSHSSGDASRGRWRGRGGRGGGSRGSTVRAAIGTHSLPTDVGLEDGAMGSDNAAPTFTHTRGRGSRGRALAGGSAAPVRGNFPPRRMLRRGGRGA